MAQLATTKQPVLIPSISTTDPPVLFGILNLNKPPAITSRDAVNQVQRLVRPTKVGHAGTLDPLATGVLVVCLGPATRLISYIQQMRKTYRATFLFGRTSDTDDIEGNVRLLEDSAQPSVDSIHSVLPSFLGEILQRPPAYSAVKVNGRRAYERARRGESFDLPPRPVRIDALTLLAYSYPELSLEIQCGSGTYIRSLGRDLAHRLGTAAVMSQLERTSIGPFHLSASLSASAISRKQLAAHLQSPLHAVAHLPTATLAASEADRVSRGLTIENRWGLPGDEMVAVNERGELLAILVPRQEGLGPAKNFATVR